jgi:hypothetical protein
MLTNEPLDLGEYFAWNFLCVLKLKIWLQHKILKLNMESLMKWE